MGRVVLLVDNSNIFIAGKETYQDSSARFSYPEFEKLCAEGDEIVEKFLAVSSPPQNDEFCSFMKKNGYQILAYKRQSDGCGHTREKGVDTGLSIAGVEAIGKQDPDRVVLLTGDADFAPLADLRDRKKKENGRSFQLEVWSFACSLSSSLAHVADKVCRIDDYAAQLVYFQNADGLIQPFREHAEEEKRAAENAEWQARIEEEVRRKAAEQNRETVPARKTADAWVEEETRKLEETWRVKQARQAEETQRAAEYPAADETNGTDQGSVLTVFGEIIMVALVAVAAAGAVKHFRG